MDIEIGTDVNLFDKTVAKSQINSPGLSNIGEIKETEDHKKLELSDSELLLQMKRMGQAIIAGVPLEGNCEQLNDGKGKNDPFMDIVRGTT